MLKFIRSQAVNVLFVAGCFGIGFAVPFAFGESWLTGLFLGESFAVLGAVLLVLSVGSRFERRVLRIFARWATQPAGR